MLKTKVFIGCIALASVSFLNGCANMESIESSTT